jgi:hypothetical protein
MGGAWWNHQERSGGGYCLAGIPKDYVGEESACPALNALNAVLPLFQAPSSG